jgi:hypothetical protein
VKFVAVAILGLAFGAAVQQLGAASVTFGAWSATAAQVSAPWLILPFVIGCTQRLARSAALLGLVVTVSALFGYFAMTYSPVEIHPWSLDRFRSGLVAVTTTGYNPLYIVGGVLTAPLFGWLGLRWSVSRSWITAAVVPALLCLEPAARWATGQLRGSGRVWVAEVVSGIVVAGFFMHLVRTSPRDPSRSMFA